MKWSVVVCCILLVKVHGKCEYKDKMYEGDTIVKSISAKSDLHVEGARFGRIVLEGTKEETSKAHAVVDEHVAVKDQNVKEVMKKDPEQWEHHIGADESDSQSDEEHFKNMRSERETKAYKDEYIDDDEEVAYKTIKPLDHINPEHAKDIAHGVKTEMDSELYLKYLKSQEAAKAQKEGAMYGASHNGEESLYLKDPKTKQIVIDEAHIKALEDAVMEKKLKDIHGEEFMLGKSFEESEIHEILKEMYGEEALMLEKEKSHLHGKGKPAKEEAELFFEKEGKFYKIPKELIGDSLIFEGKKLLDVMKHSHGGAFFLDNEGKITQIVKDESLYFEKGKVGTGVAKDMHADETFLKEKALGGKGFHGEEAIFKEKGLAGKAFSEEAFGKEKGLAGKAFHEDAYFKEKEFAGKPFHKEDPLHKEKGLERVHHEEEEGLHKKKGFAEKAFHEEEDFFKEKGVGGKAFHEEAFLKEKGFGKAFHEEEAFLKEKGFGGKAFHEEAFPKEKGFAGKAFHEEEIFHKEKGIAGKGHQEGFLFEKGMEGKAHHIPKGIYEEDFFKSKGLDEKAHLGKDMFSREGFVLGKSGIDSKMHQKGSTEMAHRDGKKIGAEDHLIKNPFLKGQQDSKFFKDGVPHGFKEHSVEHGEEEKHHLFGKGGSHEGSSQAAKGTLLMRFLSAVKAHQAENCHLVSMGKYELLSIISCISKSKNPVLCGKFVECEMKMPPQVIIALEKCKRETLGGEAKRCSRYEPLYPSLKIPAKIIKCVDKTIHKLSPEEKKHMIDFEECSRTLKMESCGKPMAFLY